MLSDYFTKYINDFIYNYYVKLIFHSKDELVLDRLSINIY